MVLICFTPHTEGASDSTRKDFLGEAHMLAQFQHQNVMTLLGVVTNKKPSLVITHFMPNGSLKTFLKGLALVSHRYYMEEGRYVT